MARDKTPVSWSTEGLAPGVEVATFAGGCFWSVQLAFDRVEGVVRTAVGYAQGRTSNPTYEEVCGGDTGHAEAVQVVYDSSLVSFKTLVDVLMKKINPTQVGGQGADHGSQYRSGIYYHTEDQKKVADAAVAAIEACTVSVEPFTVFWPAENYHQGYLEKGSGQGPPQCSAKGCNDPIRCYG